MSNSLRDQEEWQARSAGCASLSNSSVRVLRGVESNLEHVEVRRVLNEVFGEDFPLDHEVRAAGIDLEDEEERRVIQAVFGSDSASDLEEERLVSSPESARRGNCRWERVDEIQGLWLCREFLTPEQQSRLLLSIDKEKWFVKDSHNQAMRFGDLPEWVVSLSNSIRELCLEGWANENMCPFPKDLSSREPLFDQLIANVYQPGEGICAHVDLMRFEDGIAIVSLESPCVMHFTHVKQQDDKRNTDDQGSFVAKIPVLLTPGSLVLMSGEARYNWKHEINRKPGFQVWDGVEIQQQHRTSITLRKLRKTE